MQMWILTSLAFSLISEPIQICDFGLAKWLPRQWTHHNVSKFEGTFGFVSQKLLVLAFIGVIMVQRITMFLELQLFCSWILHARHSWWENRCLFIWGPAFGAHNRTPSCWSFTAKCCDMGNFTSEQFNHYASCHMLELLNCLILFILPFRQSLCLIAMILGSS